METLAFYHYIMIFGILVSFLIMAWVQIAAGKKNFGQQKENSCIPQELYKQINKNCGSWRNSAMVYLGIEKTLFIYGSFVADLRIYC